MSSQQVTPQGHHTAIITRQVVTGAGEARGHTAHAAVGSDDTHLAQPPERQGPHGLHPRPHPRPALVQPPDTMGPQGFTSLLLLQLPTSSSAHGLLLNERVAAMCGHVPRR